MSLIPARPDLTVESQCENINETQSMHKFLSTDTSMLAPVGTVCTCGRVVIAESGIPPRVILALDPEGVLRSNTEKGKIVGA